MSYINHPIGLSLILAEAGVKDESVIIAAILHDTVEDNDGGSSSDTLTVTVNNVAPTANNDVATVNEDGPAVTIDLTGNDTDPGIDDLEISSIDIVTYSTKGTVTVNPDNDTVVYNPNGQFEYLTGGTSATDSFTYTVNDGMDTDTATVTVTINGVNDEPTLDDIADLTFDENRAHGACPSPV